MIPELGHMALILALCLAVMLSVIPMWGASVAIRLRWRWRPPWRWACWCSWPSVLPASRPRFCRTTFRRKSGRLQQQQPAAPSTSFQRSGATMKVRFCSGCSFSAAGWPAVRIFSAPAHGHAGRVLAVMGLIAVGFLSFSLFTSIPSSGCCPGIPADGNDLNPAAAGPGPDHSSAHCCTWAMSVSGCLCLCHRGAAGWPSGCGLGALVAALDQRRLGLSDPRDHARQLVGLLRARLGRLVVLGSRGECLFSCPGWRERR